MNQDAVSSDDVAPPSGDRHALTVVHAPAARSERADVAARPQWPATAGRVIFGAVWLVDAVLKWLPGFRSAYMDTIMGQADGQPRWLKPWFDFWINLQHPHPYAWAYLVAVIETLIAVALLVGLARTFTFISAAVFSLLIWGTAEGFGGPYTRGASDVGTALIYALVFGALLAFTIQNGQDRYSLDAVIERRWPWWRRVAEWPIGRQGAAE